MVVHLTDNILNLGITRAHAPLNQNILQLLGLDHTGTVGIDGLECSLQLSDIILICCLDNHVHRSLLQ